ncbi:MAG: hypothetical protein KAW09_03115, partial [Thermoplasmata archaeon]|nr:hypothetical protein [Thermoplasmata archaeon]
MNQSKLISLSTEENQSYRKSGTQTILEIGKRRNDSGFKTLDKARSRGQRPTDTGGGIDGEQHFLPQLYTTTHFVFHWTNDSIDAVPLEDVNFTGTPDYVENFADIFENVWDFEITQREFLAPPTDEAEPNNEHKRNPDGRYDVFIYHMHYYGYADIEQWPNHTSYSYVAVENDFVGFFHEPQ